MLHKTITVINKREKNSGVLGAAAVVIPFLVFAALLAEHAYANYLNYQLQSERQAMACHQFKAEGD